MRVGDLIEGLTQYLGLTAVTTSLGEANVELKTKSDAQRENQKVREFSTGRFALPVDNYAPQNPGREFGFDIGTKSDAQRENQKVRESSAGRFALPVDNYAPLNPGHEFGFDIGSFEDTILIKILNNLDLVDQLCFALTCKVLLTKYKRVIKKDQLQVKVSPPPTMCTHYLPLSFINSDNKLRIRLLVRLESSRWAYCAECFLLRPRGRFTPDALKALPLKRRCLRYDGAIQLCPCLHFTRRDRNNTRVILESSQTLVPHPANYGNFGILSATWKCEGHICPFYSNNGREVQISVALCNESIGRLSLYVWHTLYLTNTVEVSSGDRSRLDGPIFACPHLDLLDLVYATKNSTMCRLCNAIVQKGPESREDTGIVVSLLHAMVLGKSIY